MSTAKVILMVLIIIISPGLAAAQAATPVAIGKVYEGGYVVVYDNYIVSIDGEQYDVEDIGVDIRSLFTVTYSRNTGDLVFAGFYNESRTVGVGYVIVYNVNDGRIVYKEFYKYSIDDNGIKGRLLSEAVYIPKSRTISTMYVNTTSAYIQVSVIGGEKSVYEAPAAFNIYTDGTGIYAALIKEGEFNDRPVRLVTAVNLLTGEEVASYPSLIPVVDLAMPLVQLFYEGGEWVGYVVVLNPSSGQLEYYRVVPGSLNLPETEPVTVSPDLRYAVKLGKTGVEIILPDGSTWSLGYDARPAPPDIYLGVEPRNAILDINENGVLLRLVNGTETVIVYKGLGGGEAVVYRVQGQHSRLTGLYAMMSEGRIVILDPVKGDVISKTVPSLERGGSSVKGPGQSVGTGEDATPDQVNTKSGSTRVALAALIVGFVMLSVLLWRRRRR